MKKIKLMELLSTNDDFAEYDKDWLENAMESFPDGISVSVAFDLTVPIHLQQYNLLCNTRIVRNATSTWSNNGSLNVFVQYYRVPPSKEDKPEHGKNEKPGFQADEESVSGLELKIKQEDADRELNMEKDVAPQTNPAGAIMIAVNQKDDISTAELPEKKKE